MVEGLSAIDLQKSSSKYSAQTFIGRYTYGQYVWVRSNLNGSANFYKKNGVIVSKPVRILSYIHRIPFETSPHTFMKRMVRTTS